MANIQLLIQRLRWPGQFAKCKPFMSGSLQANPEKRIVTIGTDCHFSSWSRANIDTGNVAIAVVVVG